MENISKSDKYFEIVKKLAVLNYDNGSRFTVRNRLDAIKSLVKDTPYKKINNNGLFEMYAKCDSLPENIVVVSSHIDCADSITRCFAEAKDSGCYIGTFDNMVTNGAVVSLMLEGCLDDNVAVVFTGDEEEDSTGASDVAEFLDELGIQYTVVVLDVTDMAWHRNACFTVENNFWSESLGRKVINAVGKLQCEWCFVPSDENHIPRYVSENKVIPVEATCDESWEYDEYDAQCFSLCIPVYGNMHSNDGVLLRKESLCCYVDALREVLNAI